MLFLLVCAEDSNRCYSNWSSIIFIISRHNVCNQQSWGNTHCRLIGKNIVLFFEICFLFNNRSINSIFILKLGLSAVIFQTYSTSRKSHFGCFGGSFLFYPVEICMASIIQAVTQIRRKKIYARQFNDFPINAYKFLAYNSDRKNTLASVIQIIGKNSHQMPWYRQ